MNWNEKMKKYEGRRCYHGRITQVYEPFETFSDPITAVEFYDQDFRKIRSTTLFQHVSKFTMGYFNHHLRREHNLLKPQIEKFHEMATEARKREDEFIYRTNTIFRKGSNAPGDMLLCYNSEDHPNKFANLEDWLQNQYQHYVHKLMSSKEHQRYSYFDEARIIKSVIEKTEIMPSQIMIDKEFNEHVDYYFGKFFSWLNRLQSDRKVFSEREGKEPTREKLESWSLYRDLKPEIYVPSCVNNLKLAELGPSKELICNRYDHLLDDELLPSWAKIDLIGTLETTGIKPLSRQQIEIDLVLKKEK